MPREEIRAMIEKKFPETNPEIGGKAYQFGRGVVQGALYDPVEGIGQLIEHASGMKIPIPQGVRNWFDKVRENTEATGTGTAGRITGAVGSLVAAPEAMLAGRAASVAARAANATSKSVFDIASKLGKAETTARISEYAAKVGKTPRQLTNADLTRALLSPERAPLTGARRLAAQAATGAALGAAQPVDPNADDFAAQKGYQALAGGALGGLAGLPIGGPLLHHALRHRYHYGPWGVVGAVTHPHAAIPSLAILSGLAAKYGLEKAGPRVAAPLGAVAGQAMSGTPSEESSDAESQ
jgi:hypothetical protein